MAMVMTEMEQHLEWVKAKMLVFADVGDWVNCLATLQIDLVTRFPELRGHHSIAEAQRLVAAGRLRTKAELRAFVETM